MGFHSLKAALFASCTVWSAICSAQLPPYSGQYPVGIVDVEVPVSNPRNISGGTLRNGQPAFELQTVLFTVFYPAINGSNSNSTRVPWVPPPVDLISNGFAQYAIAGGATFSPELIAVGLRSVASSVYIPALLDAPIVSGNQSFPVIIFSHGNAGIRTFYSHYLGELASRGAVVAAIEHRDGSGPGSFVQTSNGVVRNVTYFNSTEVSPSISPDQLITTQRAFRQAEVLETYQTLLALNNGSAQSVASKNSRGEGRTFTSWTSRLDFNRLIMAGHSYGATTALQMLQPNISSIFPAKAAIVHDPGKNSGPLNTNVSVPILISDSASWSSRPTDFYGQKHFDVVKSIAQSAANKTGAAWFLTLIGASHATISDATLVSPTFASLTDPGFNATVDSKTGTAQYVRASVEFLAFLANSTKGPILSSPVTHTQYNQSTNAAGVRSDVSQYWQIHVSSSNSTSNSTGQSSGQGGSTRSQAPRRFATESLIWISLMSFACFVVMV